MISVSTRVTFNKQARAHYLAVATLQRASWDGNFRDLSASVTRMATLGRGGRTDTATVEAGIARLGRLWVSADKDGSDTLLVKILGDDELAELDPFDCAQLVEVIATCRG